MKVKCKKCRGEGGKVVDIGRHKVFLACQECMGRGAWWPNNRRKK